MKKIGILSDTHGYLAPAAFDFFASCDEIWHAGDVGNPEVLVELQAIAPVRAVFGNCDGWDVRADTQECRVFQCEQLKIAMMHIVGKPGYYEAKARKIISEEHPNVFVAGHSHILRVLHDEPNKLLFINPGAAGRYGIHTRLTMLRLEIDGAEMRNLEVYDEPKTPKL